MNKTTEALKLAEEALEYHTRPTCMCFAGCPDCDPTYAPDLIKALAAIRDALAEPVSNERLLEAAGYTKKAKPVKPEPVAYWDEKSGEVCRAGWLKFHARENDKDRFTTPLYAEPVDAKAIREWVDLTCEEVTALIREGAADGGWQGFATRVQDALKEKNK